MDVKSVDGWERCLPSFMWLPRCVSVISLSLSRARFHCLYLALFRSIRVSRSRSSPSPRVSVTLAFSPSLSRSVSISLSLAFYLLSLALSLSLFLSFFLFLCHFLSVVSLFFFISRQLSGSVTFAVSDSRALLRGLSDVPLGFNFDIEENAIFRDFKRATVHPSAAGL